jgi:hypothetical protein
MRVASIVFICVLFPATLCAQDTVTNIKNNTLDLSVPESPAFTVLGLNPNVVTHPASPRQLAASLLNGVDQNGNFQSGVSIDTAPYLLFYGNSVTLQKYQGSRVIQFLARTGFSFATTKGASTNDKSARLAAGLSLTLFDKGDARMDKAFLNKLVNAAAEVQNSAPPISPNASEQEKATAEKEIEGKVEAKVKQIREEQRKAVWNRSSWIVAGAPSWISKDGTTSHFAANGAAVWSSLAYGFEGIPGLENNAQLIIHGRFHSKEYVPDTVNAGQFYQQQSATFGARVRFGNENTIGSFETAYVHVSPIGRPTDSFFRLSTGAEKRLTDNVWLHFGIGGESGQQNGQNKFFILTDFNWGAGPK